jgi:hypothetical protein
MNRRGFISMLAGSAGAALVPWRMEISRIIMLGVPDVLVAVSGMEIMQWPDLRRHLDQAVQPSVNFDYAFMPRSAYRAHLVRTSQWASLERPFKGAPLYYADLRVDARQQLADDLLHDWSKDQPQIDGIWS